jgi:hypothetical protein
VDPPEPPGQYGSSGVRCRTRTRPGQASLSPVLRFGGLFRERPLHESKIAIRAYQGLRTVAAKAGLDLVLRTFYSPVPHLDELPPDAFDRTTELVGIDFDLEAQLRFVADELSGPAAEFSPPASPSQGAAGYAIDNPSYSLLDATVAYAMVRRLRPGRVVELGSGHSTLVTAQAARQNSAEGSPLTLDVYDPYPSVVDEGLPGLNRLERCPAQDVPLEVFATLADGDLLFVDTTHTVKISSDVNFIVLEVLPRLRPGVVVHFHDVFLPFEYPRPWMEDFALYWNEQYLLQAFLAHNESWEVLVGVQALRRLRRAQLEAALSPAVLAHNGSGLWLRRAR